MRTRTTSALLAGMALAFGAHAREPQKPAEPQQAADGVAYYNGIKVAIDPVTGRLRQPTPAEMAALRTVVTKMPAARGSDANAMPKTREQANRTVQRNADGSVSMQVSEDMMSTLTATRQADGSITVQHAGETAKEAGHE